LFNPLGLYHGNTSKNVPTPLLTEWYRFCREPNSTEKCKRSEQLLTIREWLIIINTAC